MALALRSAARSDVGLVRDGNEDSGLAADRLLVVADGMGGHAAGEVASRLAVEALRERALTPGDDPLRQLGAAVREANSRIRADAQRSPGREGMGTTLTALLWTGDRLALAHIGDSRGYLLRDGQLRQITHDHTYVQSLVDEGRLTADEARAHPARSLILRALGQATGSEPDLELLDVRRGDRVLLCSDGLSDVVGDTALAEVLGSSDDLAEVAATLVDLALRGGGPDNVTVVVGEVVEVEADDGPGGTGAGRQAALEVGALAEDPSSGPPTRERRPVSGAEVDGTAPAGGALATLEQRGTDPETERYAPRPPRRFRRLRRIAVVLLVLAGAGALGAAAWSWTQQQFYVGSSDGQVAVFRGLAQSVAGRPVSSVERLAGGLPVAALPAVYQEEVAETIPAPDLPGADAIVERLRRAACSATGGQPTPPPTAAPSSPTLPPTPLATAPSAPVPSPAATDPPLPAPTTAPTTTAPTTTATATATPAPGVLPPGLTCPAVPQ